MAKTSAVTLAATDLSVPKGLTGPVLLADDKGRFARFHPLAITTDVGLDALDRFLSEHLGSNAVRNATKIAAVGRALQALRALQSSAERIHVHTWETAPLAPGARLDAIVLSGPEIYQEVTARTLWLPMTSSHAADPACTAPFPDPMRLGWTHVANAYDDLGVLVQELRKIKGLQSDMHHSCSVVGRIATARDRVRRLCSEMAGGRLFWSAPSSASEETDGVLVFLPGAAGKDDAGGFIDFQGAPGPLPTARLFASKTSAERAMKVQLSRWSVRRTPIYVRARLAVVGVDDKSELNAPGAGRLAAVLALAERKDLEEALASASLEQLKRRVAELEATAGVPPPAPVKRRTL